MSHPFGNITLETLNKGQETIYQLEKKKKKVPKQGLCKGAI